MDNMNDYLRWYGDFTFEEKPLTEVDNFIFCKLAYLILDGIDLSKPKKYADVVSELLATTGIQGAFYGNNETVTLAAETRRFGTVRLVDYKDVYDRSLSAQFAAMTFDLTDELRFIAYRGTDDTIAGWKEDFMISFTKTEAQKCALAYLKDNIDETHSIIVAGHSKGANLALYAAAHLDDDLQDRVSFLYMNDGPGLCPEVCDKACISKISNKAIRYMPEYSIFGKLFEEKEIPGIVVKSSAEGVMQHDITTWAVKHGKADVIESNAAGSIFINQVLDQWIESVNNEQRLNFVNNLFNSIEKSGLHTTTQIMEKGPFALEKILIELLSLDKSTVKTFMKLPVTAALDKAPDDEKASKINSFFKEQKWLPYLIMILVSIVLFIIPEYTLQAGISLLLFGVIVFELVVTVRHLWKAKWNLQTESTRVYMCIILIGIYAMLLVKEDALFLIGSVVIGIMFLAWAYRNAIKFRNLCDSTEKRERKLEKVKLIIEIVFLIILAGFIFVAPRDTLAWYMVFLGQILLVDGIVNIGFIIYDHHKSKSTI